MLERDPSNQRHLASGKSPVGDESVVVQTAEPKLRRSPLYRVIMLNDDYTPMEFVVEVLQIFFGFSEPIAIEIMLQVHNMGSASCGEFARDVAESKAHQVIVHARKHEHPLLCQIERVQETGGSAKS